MNIVICMRSFIWSNGAYVLGELMQSMLEQSIMFPGLILPYYQRAWFLCHWATIPMISAISMQQAYLILINS